MKTFLLSIIIAFGLVITTPVEAQFCSPITESNYSTCCSTYTPENTEACSAAQGSTPAQATLYCNGISKVSNESDYQKCCTFTNTVPYNANRCYDWFSKKSNEGVPGQVNSGTLGTNALGGDGTGVGGSPSASPQSGSEVLKECSAIKFKSLLDILIWIKCVITSVLIPLIFAVAFLFFLWNVLQFMRSAENTQKEEAKQRMGWGIIALFVMVGVWGIITILSGTLGIKASVPFLQTQEYLNPSSASK